MRCKSVISVILALRILGGCTGEADPTIGKNMEIRIFDMDTDPLPCSQADIFRQLFNIQNKIPLRLEMEELEISIAAKEHSFTYRIRQVGQG